MSRSEFLRQLPYFAGLGEGELNDLCAAAPEISVEPGETLLEEGKSSGAMYVVLEGEFEAVRKSRENEVRLGKAGAGEVLGEMSLLQGAVANASARATRRSRVIEIARPVFNRLLTHPGSVMAMLQTFASRLQASEAVLRQGEKMAALGRLTAGMMHELNNPAAAVRRSAAQLGELLPRWQELNARLVTSAVQLPAGSAGPRRSLPTSSLDQAEREDEVATWLEDRGVADAWQLAPALVERGWDAPALEELTVELAEEDARAVLAWLGLSCALQLLSEELRIGGERISEIVAAVKSYSRVDEAPVQEVDLHAGLEATLRILRHKLGKTGIRVLRDYDPELPRIEGYASELNQVWTNLIDNALDAMGSGGDLVLRTRSQNGKVSVEVSDTGTGIPSEIQQRIFDPFFTTKPPGEGTGLGLHTSYNIVAKHGGEIEARSRPGETIFNVVLPVRLKGAEA